MSDSDDDEMLQYKIILLGDGTVGKTSIAMRFTNDTFGQSYKQVAPPKAACAFGHAPHARFSLRNYLRHLLCRGRATQGGAEPQTPRWLPARACLWGPLLHAVRKRRSPSAL